jgi:hypothetical protein
VITAPPGSPQQLLDVVRQVNRELIRQIDSPLPVRLPEFAEADLPSAEQFKNCLARLDDGRVVSSTNSSGTWVWLLTDGGAL